MPQQTSPLLQYYIQQMQQGQQQPNQAGALGGIAGGIGQMLNAYMAKREMNTADTRNSAYTQDLAQMLGSMNDPNATVNDIPQELINGRQPEGFDYAAAAPPTRAMNTQEAFRGVKNPDLIEALAPGMFRQKQEQEAAELAAQAKAQEPQFVAPNSSVYQGGQFRGQAPPAPMQPQQPTGPMQDAIAMGLQPGTDEFNNYIRQRTVRQPTQNNTNINMPDKMFGNIPEGHKVVRGPDGSLSMRPMAGSPAEQKQKEAQQAAANQQRQQAAQADIVVQDADRALAMIQENPRLVTGWGALLQLPGGPARNLGALISTIRSNVGFDKLQAMREASPTGGALGQVSERELSELQATIGNLEQSQGAEQLTFNIQRVRDKYAEIVHGFAPTQAAASNEGPSIQELIDEARRRGLAK